MASDPPITTSTGQEAEVSGIYAPANGAKEVALSKGDRVPPANGEATTFTLVRSTR